MPDPRPGPDRRQLAQPKWGSWRVSPSGVYAILRRYGLRTRWERLTRLLRSHVEAQHPGDLVCLDAFYIGKLKGVGKVWQLTACDAACSYGLATPVPRVTGRVAIRFLRRVVQAYRHAGHRVRAVLTDGGPEFQKAFTMACRELGIEHRRTKPRHAWTNGFVERLQGTILAELWRVAFRRTYYTRLEQLDRDLQAYLQFYNRERPHQGLPPQGPDPGFGLLPKAGCLKDVGLGWRSRVQTPRPHWTT